MVFKETLRLLLVFIAILLLPILFTFKSVITAFPTGVLSDHQIVIKLQAVVSLKPLVIKRFSFPEVLTNTSHLENDPIRSESSSYLL